MQCSVSLTRIVTRPQQSPFVNNHNYQRRSRSKLVISNIGIFSVFGGQKTSSAAAELVDELVILSRPTYTGIFAGQKRKQQIAELVDELTQYAGRAPARDPNFWGNFQLIYSETPTKLAGPFRSPFGLTVFANQGLYQVLDQASKYVESFIEFKTLGLLPGFIKRTGAVSFPSPKQYRFDFADQVVDVGLGSKEEEVKSKTKTFTFDIVYLDERIRIVTLEGKDEFTIYERVEFEEQEEPSRQEQKLIEDEKQEVKVSFPFKFSLNGFKQEGGTLTIQTPKESGEGTMQLGDRPMDVVKDNLRTYQEQLQSAKQEKKELSQQLKDYKKQLEEQTKYINKLENDLARTEVDISNVNSQLDQFDQEDKQDNALLETLQNKLKQLEMQAES